MKQERAGQVQMTAQEWGAISGRRLREEALARYYSNPSRCKYCNKIIEVKDNESPSAARCRKFCNHSCSAIYNNLKRSRKKMVSCLHCGCETTNLKFCNSTCSAAFRQEFLWRQFDEQETFVSASKSLKKYLIARRGHKCEICGLKEWQQASIALILDHIDGNADNNDRSNLRLICPNCDAQLPTYKGRNIGNGRYLRRQRYHDGKSC